MKEGKTRIAVFEEGGSGDMKIAGIIVYGADVVEITQVFEVGGPFPEFIDEPEEYLPERIDADLVLDFLRHPDLSEHLVAICKRLGLPVISSGKRIEGAICPFTCCGLGRVQGLGGYGARFGFPRYRVELEDGRIKAMECLRGASCGASWQVIHRIEGLDAAEALTSIGREVQFVCVTDPSAFDPVTGKSALHFAGEVHMKALRRALEEAGWTGRG